MPERSTRHDDPGVAWMLAYKGGDERAFERIVETYAAPVFALLTRFLGASSEREDLVQEVFLRVIRARTRYEPTARFSTWLYRIAFNISVNQTERAEPKTSLESLGPADATPRELESRDADPSMSLEQDDVVRAVRSAIAALPATQRMALILAKYEELPYDEIALVLGSSEKAIKSMVHRARENLRVELAPYLAEEFS